MNIVMSSSKDWSFNQNFANLFQFFECFRIYNDYFCIFAFNKRNLSWQN